MSFEHNDHAGYWLHTRAVQTSHALWESHLGSLDGLGRWWESSPHALLEENWFPLIWDRMMHHWAVPVSLEMFFKALRGATPGDSAHFLAWHPPISEAFKLVEAMLSVSDRDKVEESIPQPGLVGEVHRQICKVIGASKAHGIDHLEEHVPRVVVGHIANHHCAAPFLRFCICVDHAAFLCTHGVISPSHRYERSDIEGHGCLDEGRGYCKCLVKTQCRLTDGGQPI